MIDLGSLTDTLLAHLRDVSQQLVGDSLPPEGSGWLDGQPNTGVFVPYLTVAAAGAAPRFSTLDIVDTAILSWTVDYQVRGHGGSRSQADWVAYQGRLAAHSMKDATFGDDIASYRVIATEWKSVGPTARNMAVDPPIWTVLDTVTLVCSRTRNTP